MPDIEKLRELSPKLRLLTIVIAILLTFFFVYTYYSQKNEIVKTSKELMIANEFNRKVDDLKDFFNLIYLNTRTISLLPSIRAIVGGNRVSEDEDVVSEGRFSEEGHRTVQQIYNILSNIGASEIYAIVDGFDPEKGEIPFFMYDSLIIEGRQGAGNSQSDLSSDFPEEMEEEEYAYHVKQIDFFRTHYTAFTFSSLETIPIISSDPVHTCDNTQFLSKSRGDPVHTMGLLYSVPFYDMQNKFRGIISTILRLNVLEALLLDVPFLIITDRDRETATEIGFEMPQNVGNFVLVNEDRGIYVGDQRAPEILEGVKEILKTGIVNENDFHSSLLGVRDNSKWKLFYKYDQAAIDSTVAEARKFLILEIAIVVIVTLFILLGIRFSVTVFRLAEFAEDDPDPVIEINLETNTIAYCNSSCKEEFPEMLSASSGNRKGGVPVNWDHPILVGLKLMVEEFRMDNVSKTLDVMEAEIGEPDSEGYRVYNRKLRYIPEDNILRLYTIDNTTQEELSKATQRLLAEVKVARGELELQHKEAEEIGRSLLMATPIGTRISASVGVEASSKAGGDRAGFLLEEKSDKSGRVEWLVVLDASGHGKGAAKFQEVALGGILSLLKKGNSMSEALVASNALLEKLGTGRFLVGNIWRVMHDGERETNDSDVSIEEFNIGQHLVMELGPDDPEVKEWEWQGDSHLKKSLPMAMFDDGLDSLSPEYRIVKKGSRIITYTDGITEAANRAGKQFGKEKLKELILKTRSLSKEVACLEIIREVKCWSGGLPEDAPEDEINEVQMEDDITLAIVDIEEG